VQRNRSSKDEFTESQKDAALERQESRCADCGEEFTRRHPGPKKTELWRTGYPPNFHHDIPVEHGGLPTDDNLVALCRHCHHWGRHGKYSVWCQECRDMKKRKKRE
jgi:hypothetical protein